MFTGMRNIMVVMLNPGIDIGLQLFKGMINLAAEGVSVKLVLQGLMKADISIWEKPDSTTWG